MGFNNFIFDAMFVIVPILIIAVFVLVVVSLTSPKFMGKMMSRQIKATKYMTDYAKEEMKDIVSNMGDVTIGSANKILKNNKENIREFADDAVDLTQSILDEHKDTFQKMAEESADIRQTQIKSAVSAIKEGWAEEPHVFCKHCGAKIDADSTFCKVCGKEQ